MEIKIQIHDEQCAGKTRDEIQAVLEEITALVSGAVLRGTEEEAA